jgi:hypothetical protein
MTAQYVRSGGAGHRSPLRLIYLNPGTHDSAAPDGKRGGESRRRLLGILLLVHVVDSVCWCMIGRSEKKVALCSTSDVLMLIRRKMMYAGQCARSSEQIANGSSSGRIIVQRPFVTFHLPACVPYNLLPQLCLSLLLNHSYSFPLSWVLIGRLAQSPCFGKHLGVSHASP